MTSSFQAECVVLVHMLREVRPDIPVLFIDTAHHFAETYAHRDRLAREWNLNLVNVRAADPEVGPLFAALEPYDVWLTALRRDQSPSRANLAEVAPFRLPTGDDREQGRAACQLDDARCGDVRGLARDPRSGRWLGQKLECGIHIEPTPG